MPRSAATRLAAGLAKGLFPPGGGGAALGGLGAPVILAGGGCGVISGALMGATLGGRGSSGAMSDRLVEDPVVPAASVAGAT